MKQFILLLGLHFVFIYESTAQRLSFDGHNDYARIDNSFFPSGDFTLEMTFETCPFAQGTRQMDMLENGNMRLRFSSNPQGSLGVWQLFHNGVVTAFSAPLYAHQTLFHVALQFNQRDTVWKLFFNGDSIGYFARALPLFSDTTYFGGRGSYFFSGYLHGICMTDSQLFKGSTYPIPATLNRANSRHYFDFDQNVGQGVVLSHNRLPLSLFNGLGVVGRYVFPPDTLFTCRRDTVILRASGGRSFTWNSSALLSGGDQEQGVFWAGSSFQGRILISDSNGCSSTHQFQVMHRPFSMVELGSDTTLCAGDKITLDAGMHKSYFWKNFDTSRTVFAGSGQWHVTVNDSGKCANSDSLNIYEFPALNISLGRDSNLSFGFALKLSPGSGFSKYIWSTGETSDSILATLSMNYAVTVTDTNGCTGSASVNIYFFGSMTQPEYDHLKHFQVFPQPAQNILNIRASIANLEWQLKDLQGATVKAGKTLAGRDTTLPVSDLPRGFYLLNFPDARLTFKISLQ